jgi:shikimate kinase
MGSGKTTIGKQLAKALGLKFYDCDHELQRVTGASVNLIFDVEGEAGFRLREKRMLEELCARKGVLIATGGGAVCDPDNRKLLKSSGLVVYLRTSVRQQAKRLSYDKSRPLLQTEDWKQKLHELARERNPLYADAADLVFSTRASSVKETLQALSSAILNHWEQGSGEFTDANR